MVNPLLLVRKVFVTAKDLTILLNKMHIEGSLYIQYININIDIVLVYDLP